MSQLDNARAVVATWHRGDHVNSWAEPARSMRPDQLTRAFANECTQLSRQLDAAADRLSLLGFLPGHSSMRRLREQASKLAREANRSFEWADHLTEAINELAIKDAP